MTGNKPSLTPSWELRTQKLTFSDGPKIMGIVNVTPDSFSDGGRHFSTEAAVEHALQLVEDGASILDVGGESTRPYSETVAEDTELSRVVPVIEKLSKHTQIPISVDTSKANVARAAIDAGAEIINDVSGFRDQSMLGVAKETLAGLCVMHMQGTPRDMQDNPQYTNVVDDVFEYLSKRRKELVEFGIIPEKICLDPGIGFGKTHDHNICLLQECARFKDLGSPILIGHSRKGFIGKLLGDKSSDRDAATAAIAIHLYCSKISVIRVHNVKTTRKMLDVYTAIC